MQSAMLRRMTAPMEPADASQVRLHVSHEAIAGRVTLMSEDGLMPIPLVYVEINSLAPGRELGGLLGNADMPADDHFRFAFSADDALAFANEVAAVALRAATGPGSPPA